MTGFDISARLADARRRNLDRLLGNDRAELADTRSTATPLTDEQKTKVEGELKRKAGDRQANVDAKAKAKREAEAKRKAEAEAKRKAALPSAAARGSFGARKEAVDDDIQRALEELRRSR